MIITICLIFLVGLFIYLFLPIIFLYRKIEDASSWKEVTGEVFDARVIRKNGLLARFINPQVFFYAQFDLDGRRFGTNNISLFKSERAQCRSFVSSMKRGQPVTIYYDPKMPHENCVLKPEDHATGMLVFKNLILFLVVLLVSLMLIEGAL